MKVNFKRFSAAAVGVATAMALTAIPAGATQAHAFGLSSTSSLANLAPGGNSGGGGNTSPGDNSGTVTVNGVELSANEAVFIKQLNDYRISKGLKPITVSQKLTNQARTWSKHMATVDNLYHSSDNVFENVAYNFNGNPDGFFTQWKNSSGHNANMLSNRVDEAGIGYAKGKDGKYYATLQLMWK